MTATLGAFSVSFVIDNLLILAYFLATNKTNFVLKLVGILKCVKICEFPEYLKFISLILNVWAGACRFQDSGCGFQAVGSV